MDKLRIIRRAKDRRKRWSRNANARKEPIRIERAQKRQQELEAEIMNTLSPEAKQAATSRLL